MSAVQFFSRLYTSRVYYAEIKETSFFFVSMGVNYRSTRNYKNIEKYRNFDYDFIQVV